MKKLITSLLLSALAIGSAFADLETYTIDQSHSSVKFSIRHFVAKTTGVFKDFEGTLTIDRDDLTKSSVVATIKVPSVDTASEGRDEHLQQDDYFNSAKYPLMTFKSTSWAAGEKKDQFLVSGDLTIMGTTKPVVLDVDLLGFGPGRNGAFLTGWEAATTIDRTEWGLTAGQPAVGDTVDITINIEGIKQ
ncbi:MAG: YceI family protein [Verrucomicrobiota bacterium]